ncbi:ATPase domain-containing protein [Virgibacillus litoralis]|uniref:Circadian clock protein KaiC n=1 Tax=Virgibacillus litoralis TaxID=578221 RepID=A0ABS4HB25_9BACI|nr:ATPase domain-containing protein [Virgibacillus litoralis]MBP1948073.1 circadian clock protein KaiC [Virgibacillus litoralis]
MRQKTVSGIPGLDNVLFGGFPQGNTIIVEGGPGTGKTTFGIQFLLEGIRKHNEPGIFITFEEFPEQIYEDMKLFNWDLRKLEQENKLRVVGLSPETLIDQMVKPGGLFEELIKEIDCKRVVIDSISLIKYVNGDERKMLYTIRNVLRKHGLTSILLQEQSPLKSETASVEHFVFDGYIRLAIKTRFNTLRKRTIEVLKMRGTRTADGEHPYRILDNGLYVQKMSLLSRFMKSLV